MKNSECSISNIYRLDGRVPLLKAVPFGLQHILAMFVSNLTPITIIAAAGGLSQADMAVPAARLRGHRPQQPVPFPG